MSNPCPDCGRELFEGRVCFDCPLSTWSTWSSTRERHLESPLAWPGPLSGRGRALLRLYYNAHRLREGTHPDAHKFKNCAPEVFARILFVHVYKNTAT